MKKNNNSHLDLDTFIRQAFIEDIKEGDHTSLACIENNQKGKAQLLLKEDGIIAGLEVAEKILTYVDSGIDIHTYHKDGEHLVGNTLLMDVYGSAQAILKAERLLLNCMQRMSGIATLTNKYVLEISGFKTKVLDTRKTTPGFRWFEKEAVRIGGGVNHRFGLFDMIMIKDNHIDFAGGISKAVEKTVTYLQKNDLDLIIEVEARNIEEVKEILHTGKVDRVMLDNFTPALTKEAVALIGEKMETESSGGITLATIRSYAECGVDYVSVGALTHGYKSLDISLVVE